MQVLAARLSPSRISLILPGGLARNAGELASDLLRYSCAPSRTGRASMARRIAIVEDEPAIRQNYADVLRKHGYK
jgi:hypothetical protein